MLDGDTDLLRDLADRAEALTKSERRIAELILSDPRAATRFSIGHLARLAGVSEPTVHRFCRKFEPRGYPEFKLRLAHALARGLPYVSSAVTPGDDTATVTTKILDSAVQSLRELPGQLAPATVDTVVDLLLDAQRIFFFGLGVSSAVAQDAEQHFFRFALPVIAHGDALMQRMYAASSCEKDLFFLISHTGRTRELVDTAGLARQRGATVVALTAAESPLARASSVAIGLQVREDTDAYMPMNSRLAHLAVLDVLAASVTLRRGEALQPHLRVIKESLRSTRYAASNDGSRS